VLFTWFGKGESAIWCEGRRRRKALMMDWIDGESVMMPKSVMLLDVEWRK
jgi:hypothetical protein